MSNPLAPKWLRSPAEANVLSPALWAAGITRTAAGELSVQGIPASTLVADYGSPLYVVDLDDVRRRAVWIRDAMADAFDAPGRHTRVYYATKALLAGDVLQVMRSEGLGCDVSSAGEWTAAVRAGVDPHLIEYQGNNKSEPELQHAIDSGVGTIVIDSAQEVSRVAAIARRVGARQAVMIRVNTGVHAGTHEYLATAREDQKFGIARADIQGVADQIRNEESLSLIGLHSHIGSQIVQPEGFVEATRRVLELYELLAADHPLGILNIGGGFAIPYTDADPEANVEDILHAVAKEVQDFVDRTGIEIPVIASEPGRIIVGPAGLTLYSVGTTKDVVVDTEDGEAHRLYVSVDGGMSDNLRPALYGAHYSARIAGRESSATPVLSRVVGSHCESGDIVVHADYLPGDIAPGDLLAVAATGAYCHSLSSNYNGFGRPALIVVEDGEARVGIRGESVDDVLSRDLGLALGVSHSAAKESRA